MLAHPITPIAGLLAVIAGGCASVSAPDETPVATFSIVAFDSKTEELGVAVQSKFLAVGAVVPYAKAGVGAVATQAFANTTYGPRGLELLADGNSAEQTIELLLGEDRGKARRQLGVVDAEGSAATFTGEGCLAWAGGIAKQGFCVQGNILAGEGVVDAMADAFEKTEGELGERMLAALTAGQDAGGDRRGRQSAAILIVKERGGYGGQNDRSCDLRVDDHETPIQELARLYRLHQEFRQRTRPRRRR